MSRSKDFRAGILLAVSLLFVISFSICTAQQINWTGDYGQAAQLAQSQQKPILIYFYNANARLCKKFSGETLTHPQVINYLNTNFINLAINSDTQMNMISKFGVYRVPTVVVLDPEGKEFLRILTHYPADKLLESLGGVNKTMASRATVTTQPSIQQTYPRALFYEPFESIRGWGNEGSTEGAIAQISLIKGVRGNAFRIDYELKRDSHNYIQIHRELDPRESFTFPAKYTVVVHLAATGGNNGLDLKFADADGTNYGTLVNIPVDGKGHKYVFTSDDIKYLWGGDKSMDRFHVLLIAVSSKDALNPQIPNGNKGAVFIDELVILPGIHRNI
jgi:thioredoxin-related protein